MTGGGGVVAVQVVDGVEGARRGREQRARRCHGQDRDEVGARGIETRENGTRRNGMGSGE